MGIKFEVKLNNPNQLIKPSDADGKVVFNGHAYESIEAMPPDVRQAYEQAMDAVMSRGELPETADSMEPTQKTTGAMEKGISGTAFDTPKPIAPESSILRLLIVGLLLFILIAGLYYLLYSGK